MHQTTKFKKGNASQIQPMHFFKLKPAVAIKIKPIRAQIWPLLPNMLTTRAKSAIHLFPIEK